MNTIKVSSSEELTEAYDLLSNADGGRIEVEAGRDPIQISIEDGGGAAVTIASADESSPTLLHRIAMTDVRNVVVENFEVDSTGVDRPDWHDDLMLGGTEDVVIRDTDFSSDANGRYGVDKGAELGADFALIRGVEGFEFSGNTVSNYYQGLTLRESEDVVIAGNEFTQLQGDGIRMVGVQEVEIDGNRMHDFLGTARSVNHNDFIQVWSTGSKQVTGDLKITDNILDAGDGASTQAIFIGNERHGKDKGHVYDSIEISGNLIHNASYNGIAVFGARDVEVTGNTLLWNQQAEVIPKAGADGISRAPAIRLGDVKDGSVTGNITSGLKIDKKIDARGNEVVTYGSVTEEGHVDTHFVNASGGGALELADLRLRPGSDWNGDAGSPLSQALAQTEGGVEAVFTADAVRTDLHSYAFDASLSADGSGRLTDAAYDFVWTFADGTVREGISIVQDLAGEGAQEVQLSILKDGTLLDESTRILNIPSKTLLDIDFEDGLVDASSYASRLSGSTRTVDGANGSQGYLLDKKSSITVAHENAQIHALETFSFGLDLQVQEGEDGRFVLLHKTMDARVNSDGTVRFTLQTDEGKFRVESGDVTIDDGAFHNIGFDYDGAGGSLSMSIDGTVVGSVDASGTTAKEGSQDLVLGSKWNSALEGVIDNVFFGSDPGAGAVKSVAEVVEVAEVAEDEAETGQKVEAAVPTPVPTPAPAPQTASGGAIVAAVGFSDGGAATQGAELSNLKAKYLEEDGSGYHIGRGHSLQLDRDVEEIHEMSSFEISMDVTLDKAGSDGMLLHFRDVFSASVDKTGSLSFTLETDEGRFGMRSGSGLLETDEAHRIAVSYDDDDGAMFIFVDGVEVASAEASGTTTDESYYGLSIGHTWSKRHHDTVDALVDDFVFLTAPGGDAGAYGDLL